MADHNCSCPGGNKVEQHLVWWGIFNQTSALCVHDSFVSVVITGNELQDQEGLSLRKILALTRCILKLQKDLGWSKLLLGVVG